MVIICCFYLLFLGLPALEDVDEFESQAASVPNTSALETLVRTACESLAVSTLFSGNPSAQVNALNASDDQQTCKDGSPSGVDGNSESIDASSSCSHNVLDQVSAEDDVVFNAIFGNGRDSAVADGNTEEACNLSLQETPLDLTNENLSDIGDAEVCLPVSLFCFVFACVKHSGNYDLGHRQPKVLP